MLVTIFTYNRFDMLNELTAELKGLDKLIIDDGSNWPEGFEGFSFIRTQHEGKKGFWKKWLIATQVALGTNHDYFLFLPDDIKDLDLDTIKQLTEQGWEDKLFCLNLGNEGQFFRWGAHTTGAPDFKLNEYTFKECGYIDGLFLTNRKTLELFDVQPIPSWWFDRPDKSSGVGYFLTKQLREKGVTMYKPDHGFCYHGEHNSVMHPDHRKETPLIIKRK